MNEKVLIFVIYYFIGKQKALIVCVKKKIKL